MQIALALLNSLIFYVAWGYTVHQAANGDPYTGMFLIVTIVAIYLAITPKRVKEFQFFALLTLLGTGIDSVWASSKLVLYESGYSCPSLAPLWISALWLLFAYAVSTSLYWMYRFMPLSVISGMIGGPLTYYASFKLGAGTAIEPLPIVMIILSVAWGLIFPGTLLLRHLIVEEPQIDDLKS